MDLSVFCRNSFAYIVIFMHFGIIYGVNEVRLLCIDKCCTICELIYPHAYIVSWHRRASGLHIGPLLPFIVLFFPIFVLAFHQIFSYNYKNVSFLLLCCRRCLCRVMACLPTDVDVNFDYYLFFLLMLMWVFPLIWNVFLRHLAFWCSLSGGHPVRIWRGYRGTFLCNDTMVLYEKCL